MQILIKKNNKIKSFKNHFKHYKRAPGVTGDIAQW
jgi:hypothetical protein